MPKRKIPKELRRKQAGWSFEPSFLTEVADFSRMVNERTPTSFVEKAIQAAIAREKQARGWS